MSDYLWQAVANLIIALFFYWLGRSAGYRRGLSAPLTQRQRAITADVRRRNNGQGVALVRRRSADYSRPERGTTSRRKGG